MKTAVFVVGLVFVLAVTNFGQARTVTNASLAKFQQKRLAAERDYRDNYARMGFPSPEELEKQRDADMAARLELAEQLRQARLEKERLELERRNLDLEAARLEAEIASDEAGAFYGGYFGGFGLGGFTDRPRGRHRRSRGPFPPFGGINRKNRLDPVIDRRGAYRVTPFGVIPVPNPQPTRLIFRGGRRR